MAVQQSPISSPRPEWGPESIVPPATMPGREKWGYAFWAILVTFILVTECLAAFWKGFPIPTISGTTGRLEREHTWVKVIVLGGIVTLCARVIFYPAESQGRGLRKERAMTKWDVGYVCWGLFAVAVLIPELLAIFGRSFTPFPGIARAATNLEARQPWIAMLFLAGLAILAVHLILYPWPDIH
jgi:hypothetical protein